jgi:hypothetical protein
MYTIGDSDQRFYGKYYGYTPDVASHDDFLNAIFPSLQQCYSLQSKNAISLSILPHYSTRSFSNRDPNLFDFVYCNISPPHFYFNGKRMNTIDNDDIFKDIMPSNKIETEEIEKEFDNHGRNGRYPRYPRNNRGKIRTSR